MQRLTLEDIEAVIEKGVSEITVNATSLADAAPRAGRFLVYVSLLTDYMRQLEEELPKHQTLVNAQYSQAIQRAGGKNITEKKVEAEADPAYSGAVEAKAEMDAKRDWIKGYIKIFDNAHVMFRQYSNARNS